MNIDFKITTWERVLVPEDVGKEIFEQIKSGKIKSTNDIFNSDFNESGLECNHVLETDEQMSIEENDGQPTIEVLENHAVIWDNVNK